MEMNNELNDEEFRFFLTGGVSLGEALPDCPCTWLAEKSWGEMNRLAKLRTFNGWIEHFNKEHETYRKLYDSSAPQDFELPEQWKHLDRF